MKQFDLEDRTFTFSKSIRSFVKILPKTISNIEDSKQLIRSSGSVGANYIEANEALSKKDFLHRIKICRKEVKETRYWLRLVDCGENRMAESEQIKLIQESTELLKIFNAVITKTTVV